MKLTPRLHALARRLSLGDPLIVVCAIAIAAWLIPQAYIGNYLSLFEQNELALHQLGGWVIGIAAVVIAIATLFAQPFNKPRQLGTAALLAFSATYYGLWRYRYAFVHNDEDKLIWLNTAVFLTGPIATIASALILFRCFNAIQLRA